MLATAGTEVPRGKDWVFEPKYDGIRILAFADKGAVTLVSRNSLNKTKQFPEVAGALRELHKRVRRPFVVDGEIVAMHGHSPARFQNLQSRMHVTDRGMIESHRGESPAALIVFDLLIDGKTSLVTEPWRERRKHLAALLQPPGRSDALRLSDVSNDGEALMRRAREHEWEGIIAKRVDAPYDMGHRSRAWLKLKIERRQEFVVGGWTEPRKARQFLGAILVGYYRDGDLVYAGHTGTGFTQQSLTLMYRQLRRIERRTSPFSATPKTNEPAHWVRPEVVVEIKFSEWTADGKLRQPVFVGVRDDKSPREVMHEPESLVGARRPHDRVRARPARRNVASLSPARLPRKRRASPAIETRAPARRSPPDPADVERIVAQLAALEGNRNTGELSLPTGALEVSNLDKVFFPVTRQTKGDLMRFYARLSPYLLAAIADRPLVMKRFPNGVRGKAFYQQRAPANPPSAVRVEPVSDEGLATQRRLIGGDLATLLYLVQLGAISVDPSHSRVQSVPFADYSIIDLDPGPRAPFGRVVEVAHAVKTVLDGLGLNAVPKTSGATGLHIVLPLAPGVPNDGARTIAELVATMVAERFPRVATVERWVNSRARGAVYVDYLQNIRGKTVAGVYSVRAVPRATVSTPLDWSEVDDRLTPAAFTMDAVLERVRRRGDLWARGMARTNRLDGLVSHG
ncbi:MAG: DNA ligase D [Gemmatimonadales bacterium]